MNETLDKKASRYIHENAAKKSAVKLTNLWANNSFLPHEMLKPGFLMHEYVSHADLSERIPCG